jgi:hypothetical protein
MLLYLSLVKLLLLFWLARTKGLSRSGLTRRLSCRPSSHVGFGSGKLGIFLEASEEALLPVLVVWLCRCSMCVRKFLHISNMPFLFPLVVVVV